MVWLEKFHLAEALFAYVNPAQTAGITEQIVTAQFNGTVAAARSREHGFKALQRNICVSSGLGIGSKWTDPANLMAGKPFHILRVEHFCLTAKLGFKLCVINFPIPSRYNQNTPIPVCKR